MSGATADGGAPVEARAERVPAARVGLDASTRCLEALCTLMAWTERRRQRRRLAALASDADFLHDVGISRVDALREARRPFWRA